MDYLSGLNTDCLWLQPFFPSPGRDHGYDISDYYGIDPRFGTLGDFLEFSHAARDRGIRIIADLVVNDTSIDNPWFQAARRDSRSKYRKWYVPGQPLSSTPEYLQLCAILKKRVK